MTSVLDRAVERPELPTRPGLRVRILGEARDVPWTGQTHGVWLDLETPADDELDSIRRAFPVNPLALDDALTVGHWARFEVYPEHIFLIFRTLAEPERVNDVTERVSILWYPELGSLITIRNEPVTYLEEVWNEFRTRPGEEVHDVLYALLQRGTDTFFTFLDALEGCTDELEERVFTGPTRAAPPARFAEEVFSHRHTMLAVRRLASGARENVAHLSRHASAFSPEAAVLVRDVVDHLTRVYDGIDAARDVLGGLLDVHLSVQGNRMNEVMKTLTTVSTIFLPLTFLAGIWGMNFRFMPELDWPFGYPLAWSAFALVGIGLAAYFRRKGWW